MNFDPPTGERGRTDAGAGASTRREHPEDPARANDRHGSELGTGESDGRANRLSRRTVIERGTALGAVLFGAANGPSVAAADQGGSDGRAPPSVVGRGPGGGESWKRLYQGTMTETLTYFSQPDREPTGQFAVEVRFDDTAMLATTGPPFAFELRSGVLLSGDFVTFEHASPYAFGPELIEGSVWIDTERREHDVTRPPERAWELTYDTRTNDVQGALVQPSSYVDMVNAFVVGEVSTLSGDFLPAFAQFDTQSTFEGTVGEDILSLRFDVVDVEQTVSATVDVTAERRA